MYRYFESYVGYEPYGVNGESSIEGRTKDHGSLVYGSRLQKFSLYAKISAFGADPVRVTIVMDQFGF